MSEGSPLWGAGNVRPKHQRVEQNFTNFITPMPVAHLKKGAVLGDEAADLYAHPARVSSNFEASRQGRMRR